MCFGVFTKWSCQHTERRVVRCSNSLLDLSCLPIWHFQERNHKCAWCEMPQLNPFIRHPRRPQN